MKRDGRKIRVIIADGEPLIRECVRAAFTAEPDMQVVAECATGIESASAIQAYRPDVLLIAVSMADGGAFDVIEEVGPDRIPNVVFLAAADDHMIRGFDAYALDYIVTPITADALAGVIAKCRARAAAPSVDRLSERLTDFIANRDTASTEMAGSSRTLTRFMIRERERIRFIAAEDVDWIEGARNYVRLHVGEKTHLLRGPLTAIHAQLEPSKFARIHRSIIVNVDRIGEVQPWVGGDYVAILRSGERLRVSRNFRDTVVRRALSA